MLSDLDNLKANTTIKHPAYLRGPPSSLVKLCFVVTDTLFFLLENLCLVGCGLLIILEPVLLTP